MTDRDGVEFSDVVIHIGYHKTGSTLLQRHLFVAAAGCHSPWPESFYHRNVLLVRPDSMWARRVRAAFVPGIDEARELGKVPVLSCEALSGDIWRLGQANGYANFHVGELLAEAFPGARVVMVHREQVSMICSLYKHSIRSHWRYSVSEFLDQRALQRGLAPLLNLGYLEYSWLFESYVEQFGRSAVWAVPFEELRNREAWAVRWGEILGVHVDPAVFAAAENPAMSAMTVRGKRLLNYLIPASAMPNLTRTGQIVNAGTHLVDQRLPQSLRSRSDEHFRDQVEQLVGDRYFADNRRFEGLTGEDLTRWGYV